MSIRIRRRHGMTLEQARNRVEAVAEELKARLAVDCHWQANRLVFSRRGAAGAIRVDELEVEVNVELGLMLRGLERSIRSAIEQRLDQALAG
jgi:putative polyhydroxyalkanoate system protein